MSTEDGNSYLVQAEVQPGLAGSHAADGQAQLANGLHQPISFNCLDDQNMNCTAPASPATPTREKYCLELLDGAAAQKFLNRHSWQRGLCARVHSHQSESSVR